MSDTVQTGPGPGLRRVGGPPGPAGPAGRQARHRGLALGLILLAQLLVVIDVSIVTLALPSIQRSPPARSRAWARR